MRAEYVLQYSLGGDEYTLRYADADVQKLDEAVRTAQTSKTSTSLCQLSGKTRVFLACSSCNAG